MTNIPRRCRIDQQTPMEAAIRAAMSTVENGPADERLTRAVVLLGDALNAVADFVDGVPPDAPAPREDDAAYSVVEWAEVHESSGGRHACAMVMRGEDIVADCYSPEDARRIVDALNRVGPREDDAWLVEAIRDGIRAAIADEPTSRVGIIGRDTAPYIARAVQAYLCARSSADVVSDAAVEAVARYLCRFKGDDPDWEPAGGPRWKSYEGRAVACLRAAYEAGRG